MKRRKYVCVSRPAVEEGEKEAFTGYLRLAVLDTLLERGLLTRSERDLCVLEPGQTELLWSASL